MNDNSIVTASGLAGGLALTFWLNLVTSMCMQVIAVVRSKLLFKTRPKPIISKPPAPVKAC